MINMSEIFWIEKHCELEKKYNNLKDKYDVMRQTYIDAVSEIKHDLENMEKVIRNRLI